MSRLGACMRFLRTGRGWEFGSHGERAVSDLLDGDKGIDGNSTEEGFAMDPGVQLRWVLSSRLQILARTKDCYERLADTSKWLRIIPIDR